MHYNHVLFCKISLGGGEKTDLYLQGGQRIMIVDMKLPFGIVSKMTFLILAR